MPLIAIGLVLAAALGGGAATLAEQSLPGDPLWGFKVHINEGVAGLLATSDEAKAEWDLSAINTRLSEAQQLASSGSLSGDAQADIEANIQSHAQGIAADINKLNQDGQREEAADVATRFQAAMASGASTLALTDASASADVQSTLTPLLTSVRATLDDASNISAEVSAQATTTPSQTK